MTAVITPAPAATATLIGFTDTSELPVSGDALGIFSRKYQGQLWERELDREMTLRLRQLREAYDQAEREVGRIEADLESLSDAPALPACPIHGADCEAWS